MYMLERKGERARDGERQRERKLYIHIHCVPRIAADVKIRRERLTDQREFLTHHEICIIQGNY